MVKNPYEVVIRITAWPDPAYCKKRANRGYFQERPSYQYDIEVDGEDIGGGSGQDSIQEALNAAFDHYNDDLQERDMDARTPNWREERDW